MSGVIGYGAEPAEVAVVLAALVGDRDGEDPSAWYTHLSSCQALLDAAVKSIADQRARVAAEIYREMDPGTYAKLADHLGVSRARAQQFVERDRDLSGDAS